MKKNILFLSPYPPHSKISHAGGQLFNFYFKNFVNDNDFNVALITPSRFVNYDLESCYLEYKNVKHFSTKQYLTFFYKLYHMFNGNKLKDLWYEKTKLKNIIYLINSYSYTNGVLKGLRRAQKAKFKADIIVLEFTEMLFYIEQVKKIFKNSTIITVEHDINFQGVGRKIGLVTQDELLKKSALDKFKKKELNSLNQADLIFTLNSKDIELIRRSDESLINKTKVLTPYYNSYVNNFESVSEGIVFFGAMGRMENQTAVDWFISNCWQKLSKTFPDLKFYVVGSGLDPNKKNIQNEKNIIYTGYVENPAEYFSKAICGVLPLIYGAGIKIKILELMSYGVPILTNEIGMEGINAKKGEEFLYCSEPEEYIENIMLLKKDSGLRNKLIKNGKQFIEKNFDLKSAYSVYKSEILKLCN